MQHDDERKTGRVQPTSTLSGLRLDGEWRRGAAPAAGPTGKVPEDLRVDTPSVKTRSPINDPTAETRGGNRSSAR